MVCSSGFRRAETGARFTASRLSSKIKHEADVAQLVEQSIRNRQVIGSSPIVGSILPVASLHTARESRCGPKLLCS